MPLRSRILPRCKIVSNNERFNTMPTRLPDNYFTTNPMYGAVPSEGAVMPSPTVYQGEDAQFLTRLLVDGTPVSLNDYSLTFVVKKSETACNTMIRDQVTSGADGYPEGFYQLSVQASKTSRLRPGTYYFAVVGVQKPSGRTLIIQRGTFNIELSAASPNPNLAIPDGELTADTDSQSSDSMIYPAESTDPRTPDIGYRF